MQQLFETSKRRIHEVPTDLVRYKYGHIAWKSHAFGLVGPRGVGKSTMLLQHIKQHLSLADTLYVSADNLYFASHTLIDLADRFYKMGGKHLFIDEIHKYDGWSVEIKQIFDSYPDLQLVISGSSILDITKGMTDLSRRIPVYEMQGLSFREYLHLFHGVKAAPITIEQLLKHEYDIPGVKHPLPLFHDYLRRGYYPFGTDEAYDLELMQVITQTMESDIPLYMNANVSVGRKLKQLLMVVAESVPFKPVMQKLAEATDISRNYIQDYLMHMERAGMIAQLRNAVGGIRGLGKTEKLYLDNTNLLYALSPQRAEIGNVRETFFMNQMRVVGDVMSSPVSDFLVSGRTFEIGGRKKGQKQISEVENGYIVKDDIESGYANVLPLWSFGLLY
jgi:uncharacterized protein